MSILIKAFNRPGRAMAVLEISFLCGTSSCGVSTARVYYPQGFLVWLKTT